ncbi:MAG: AraC family transcriptional regulator [Candidatus Eisenbacteria bacterium]|nr:AraC family transcriptional regulator [Candidatus Eisenbacteria bacterium]
MRSCAGGSCRWDATLRRPGAAAGLDARRAWTSRRSSGGTMAYKIEIKTIETQAMVSIRATTRPEDIGATLETILPEVWRHLQDLGMDPAGPPFTRYCEFEQDRVGLEAGFPVTTPLGSEGRIADGHLPGGKVAVTWHVGPFHRLREAYTALEAWLREERIDPTGPPWEVYWTDPGTEPDPDKLRTEIFLPIA